MEHEFDHMWKHGHPPGPGPGDYSMLPGLLSLLNTVLWLALFIGLIWLLLRWFLPHILLMITTISGKAATDPSALEILRQRYAAGEIDAVTFEQMCERLEASYRRSEAKPAE